MIKYVEFDSIDDYGQHIIPINDALIKTASSSYSPEVMAIISNMDKDPNVYYVVINALGSYEMWGGNRNGDAFPVEGLAHRSLRTDMKTDKDYGYKTFEYYAKLFKHHVNKLEKGHPFYGDVVYSHWNPKIQRVELIVGIDRSKAPDIIDAIEAGELVSVSMGCKVRYDRCNICDNKARTRPQYCKHLKYYLRKMVTEELAEQWSRELGKKILPGTVVLAMNDHPRFFDISKVHVGADRTSFMLGKAASEGTTIASVDIADAYGFTDEMFDKIAGFDKAAILKKKSEIDKEIGGFVISQKEADALKKIIDDNTTKIIESEERIPISILDPIAKGMPLESIFSTMLGLGIHPKPQEFQRIVIINAGMPDIAEKLDRDQIIFDRSEDVEPIHVDVSPNHFSDMIGKLLLNSIHGRSCFPPILEDRINSPLSKESSYLNTEEATSPVGFKTALAGIAGLYAGLKMKAMGYNPKQIVNIFSNKPWLTSLIGAGVLYKLLMKNPQSELNEILQPASKYQDSMRNTYFGGHIKQASIGGSTAIGALIGAALYPSSYAINSYNQRSLYTKGKPLFPGAGMSPKAMAITGGITAAGAHYLGSEGFNALKTIGSKLIKR